MAKVFINCPFDPQYKELLHTLLFTLLYLKHEPLLASSDTNCRTQRLSKITNMMLEADFSIHDLSLVKAPDGTYCRMNMPFELGLDFGLRHTTDSDSAKEYLILENEKYCYQKALSDIAGLDIKAHNNDPKKIIRIVRHWFTSTTNTVNSLSPNTIWIRFTQFQYFFYQKLGDQNFTDEDIDSIETNEIISSIKGWLDTQA